METDSFLVCADHHPTQVPELGEPHYREKVRSVTAFLDSQEVPTPPKIEVDNYDDDDDLFSQASSVDFDHRGGFMSSTAGFPEFGSGENQGFGSSGNGDFWSSTAASPFASSGFGEAATLRFPHNPAQQQQQQQQQSSPSRGSIVVLLPSDDEDDVPVADQAQGTQDVDGTPAAPFGESHQKLTFSPGSQSTPKRFNFAQEQGAGAQDIEFQEMGKTCPSCCSFSKHHFHS